MIKIIPNTNNAYGCDEQGNIYSYYLRGSHDRTLQDQPQKLIPYRGSNNDYLMVGITLNGHTSNVLVHRLVALTWIDNPNNFNVVHHKDGNVNNNSVLNLEWTDQKSNLDYAKINYGELNGLKTKTKLFSPENELLGEFDSISSAADFCRSHYGVSSSSLKRHHKSNGFYLIPDHNPKLEQAKKQKKKTWELFTPDGELIGEFKTIIDAGRYIKENVRDISLKLFQTQKKSYGYYVKEKCRD